MSFRSRLPPRTLILCQLREHLHRPLRCALILTATALGVAAVLATRAVDAHIFRALETVRAGISSKAPMAVTSRAGGVPLAILPRLEALPRVASALPFVAMTLPLENSGASLLLLGMDLERASRYGDDVLDLRIDPLVLLRPKPFVIVTKSLAASLRVAIGDELTVMGAKGRTTVAVAGTFSSPTLEGVTGGSLALGRLRLLGELSGQPDLVDRIDLHPSPGVSVVELRSAVAAALPPGLEVTLATAPTSGVEDAFGSVRLGLLFSAFIAVLAGAFLISNAHAVALEERRPRLAITAALGADRTQLLGSLAIEGLLLGAIGSALGVPLGQALSQFAVLRVRDNLPLLGLPGSFGGSSLVAADVVIALTLGTGATLAAMLLPAVSISRNSLARSLIPGPVGVRSRWHVGVLPILGIVLLALARWGFPTRIAQWPYFAVGVVVVLVVAGCPALVRWVTGLARAASTGRPILAQAIATLERHPLRSGLPVAAVGLAVALSVQGSAVIASFESTLLPWVERSLTGDLFLISGSGRIGPGRNLPLDSAILGEVAEVPGVVGVRGVRTTFLPVGSEHRYVVGLDTSRYPSGGFLYWHDGDPVAGWAAVSRGEACLCSDNLATRAGLSVGDELTLPGLDGDYRLELAGIVTDYSWNRGTILLDREVLIRRHGLETLDIVAILAEPGLDIAALRTRLVERFGASRGAVVLTAEGFRNSIVAEIRTFFAFAGAQTVVLGIIAFLAVANTVALSILTRRREFQLLRALGATPFQRMAVAVLESSAITCTGLIAGLGLGALIARVLLRDLLRFVSGWTMPLVFPWTEVGEKTLVALVLGAVSGALAALTVGSRNGSAREE